jgi:hypothetical protein
MTTYVLDSSVAFKCVVPEIDTDKAVALRDDFRNGVIHQQFPEGQLRASQLR